MDNQNTTEKARTIIAYAVLILVLMDNQNTEKDNEADFTAQVS